MAFSTPISENLLQSVMEEMRIKELNKASIREIKKLSDTVRDRSGLEFIRMEMGVPGLPAAAVGIEAEIAALRQGVASKYPDIQGEKPLKTEISRFVKNFLDIEVNTEGCLPTVGSMQGGFASFMLLNRIYENRDTILFIDPGFPVHKQQVKVLGNKFEQFDVYEYRGEKLYEKLDSILSKGHIHSMLYSNPNNPSWICFTDEELKMIAAVAKKHDVVVLEDLAYFGMDFRKDYSHPGVAPFQPSVAKYYDKYILFISSSKSFSYAGQRIGMMVISDALFATQYPALKRFYSSDIFGTAMIFGSLYTLSSGTSHSAQYGLAGILKAVNDGTYNFRDDVIEYGEKARIMKQLFAEAGFQLVYDQDLGEPLADGFYFTISYPGLSGEELQRALLLHGISAISLASAGSIYTNGMRACVSQVMKTQFPLLKERLEIFKNNYGK